MQKLLARCLLICGAGPNIRQRGKLSAAEAEAERLSYYAGLLRRAGSEPGRKALDGVWRKIPQKLKKESSLIGAYVNERLRHADSSDCEPVLRRALKRQWDSELVRLFGLVEGRSLKRQMEFAEERLTRSPGDPALLLALGRLCKRNRLWGKARSYQEQSIEAGPDPAACRELAVLLDQQGEHDAARLYLQQGLNLATDAREGRRGRNFTGHSLAAIIFLTRGSIINCMAKLVLPAGITIV